MFSWATKHSVSKSKRLERTLSLKRRLLFEGLERRRVFAAYEVTTLQDIVNPDDGVMSLREAIAKANETSVSDTVTFAASLMSSGDATIKLNGTELAITQPVEIRGPTSARLTIDADLKSRVFKIGDLASNNSQEITISNLRLVNGQSRQGGAIYSTETLILVGCTIENSSAELGGAIYTTNMLNVWESNLSRNRATQSGGAIYAGSDLSVVDSTIALNSATQNGGGIAIGASNGYFVLINATVVGNTAGNGGGVSAESVYSSRIANSIIAGNLANSGVANDIVGLSQWQATYNLIGVSSTEWNNGYQNNVLGIDWKTIVENDGLLPILKNNGGRTETIAILRNGPAANTGNNELFGDIATRIDQRGLPRLHGGRIDIGALELHPVETITTLAASNRRYDGQAVTFSVDVKSQETATVLPTGTVMLNFYASADKSALAHTGFITLENGTGQYRFSEQGLGIYRVETEYFGDVNFLSSGAAALERTGPEVDYGDAPSSSQSSMASSYPVTFDENGARHTNALRGVILGRTISPAAEGIHSANADADTSDDGVSWPFPLISSSAGGLSTVLIENGGGVVGKIDAWIDFNCDGDWNDDGEKIFDSAVLDVGTRTMTFAVPGGAAVGTTAARFRVSLNGKLEPTGAAYDGEVEDYMVEIVASETTRMNLSSAMADWIAGMDFVDGNVTMYAGDGQALFKNQFNPEIELVLTPRAPFGFRINSLVLERSGPISVRSRLDQEFIKLLGATNNLLVRQSSSNASTNRISEIDASGVEAHTITLQTPQVPHLRIRHGFEDTLDLSGWSFVGPSIVNGEHMHRWTNSGSTLEIVNPTPFHNPMNKYDVDFNGTLTAIDVLATINALVREKQAGPMDLSNMDPTQWRYTDVNGDGKTTPIDVLILINELKRLSIPVSVGGGVLTISGMSVGAIIRGDASLTVSSGNNVYLPYANVNGGSLTLTQAGLNQSSNSIDFGNGTAANGSLKKGSMEVAITPAYNASLVRVVGRRIQIDTILPTSLSGVFQTFPFGDASANQRSQVRTERPTSTTLQLTPILGLTTLVSTSGNVSPITVVSSSGIGSQITISNSSPLSSGVLVIRGSVGNLSIP